MAQNSISISSGRPTEENPGDQFLSQMEGLVSKYRCKGMRTDTFERSYRGIPSARDRFALICVAIESGLGLEAIYRVVKDGKMPENQPIQQEYFLKAMNDHFLENGFYSGAIERLLLHSIGKYKTTVEAKEITETSADIAQQILSNKSE